MAELEQALVLFTKASKYSIRALKSLPVLTRLAEKARYALADAKASSAGDGWSTIQVLPPANVEHDELSIFAGHTRFVSAAKGGGDGDNKGKGAAIGESSSSLIQQSSRQLQPPQQRPQLIYGWQHSEPTQFEYAYVPSDQTVQQQQAPQPIDTSTSEEPQSYSQWSTDPVILHPPTVPRVSQSYGLSADYQRHQQQRNEDQIGTIELHPAYYPTPSSTHSGHPSSVSAPQQRHHVEQRSTNVSSTFTPSSTTDSYIPISYPNYPSSFTRQPPVTHLHHHHHHHHHQPHQQQQQATYDHMPDVAELADLGLASRDSRLDERWSSFMADSGLLEGFNYGVH
jgi:hypothetical protein